MVTLSGYIAIYIARTSTESYVDFQYEPKLALYALYPRRMYVGTSMRVIRLIESNKQNRPKSTRETNGQKYHGTFYHLRLG